MNVSDFIASPHPFLTGMCGEHLRVLAGFAMQTHFAAGTVIFREGDIANRFYLIQRGKVSLESRSNGSPPIPIQILGPGEVLGWSWLFPPYTWHFDAWAIENTDAIFFYGTRLREECETDKAFGYELMKRVSEIVIHRLQATRRKLIAQRVCDPLSELPVGK
ncbi:Crp/Fnr family transcriptional regulator [Verrucomicrobiota bacterium sgz303538]